MPCHCLEKRKHACEPQLCHASQLNTEMNKSLQVPEETRKGKHAQRQRTGGMQRWLAQPARRSFPRRSQQATRDPGWSKDLISIYVTDNPTWCPSDCKRSTVLRQEMSHGRRRTMHRPEDIIPEYAQPFLKAQRTERIAQQAVAETDTEAGKVTISWWAQVSLCLFSGPEDNGILGQTDFPRKLGLSKPHKLHFSNINREGRQSHTSPQWSLQD